MDAYIGTKTQCTELVRIADKAAELPAAGVHIGAGRHVEMRPVFAPGAPGWTATFAAVVDDSSASRRGSAVNVDGMADLSRTKLTALEQTTLVNALNSAVTLPADWVKTSL